MNSFYTDQPTIEKLGTDSGVRTFCQARCPRIYADTLLPVEENGSDEEWVTASHSGLLAVLRHSH